MHRTTPIVLWAALAGCSSATNLEDAEHVRVWATGASALGLFTPVYEPVALADGEHTFPDPACPVITDDGTTLAIAGECTASDGRRFIGRVEVVRGADGEKDVTFDGYGASDEDPAPTFGTAAIRRRSLEEHTFDLDLRHEGIATTIVRYAGRVVGTYEGRTEWSGEGDVEREGWAPVGAAHAITEAQVRDQSVCGNAPASGRTTLTFDDPAATLVVEYDGATACDEERAARYSVDGADRGLVTGIGCAAAPGRGAGGGIAVALLALAWALRRR